MFTESANARSRVWHANMPYWDTSIVWLKKHARLRDISIGSNFLTPLWKQLELSLGVVTRQVATHIFRHGSQSSEFLLHNLPQLPLTIQILKMKKNSTIKICKILIPKVVTASAQDLVLLEQLVPMIQSEKVTVKTSKDQLFVTFRSL